MKRRTNYNMGAHLNNQRTDVIMVNDQEIHYDDLLVVRNPTITGTWKFKWMDGHGNVTVFGPCNKQGTPKNTAQHRTFNFERIMPA